MYKKIFDSMKESMKIASKSINDLNTKPDYVKSMTIFPYTNIIF